MLTTSAQEAADADPVDEELQLLAQLARGRVIATHSSTRAVASRLERLGQARQVHFLDFAITEAGRSRLKQRAFIPVATFTGIVDLAAPQASTISIEAMAHGLAIINRWAGATELPISVAQHSNLVADIFVTLYPALAGDVIHARLHDGHEYVVGDKIRPIVARLALDWPGVRKAVADIKAEVDSAILEALCLLPPSPEVAAAVAHADEVALATEWKLLIPHANGAAPFETPPFKRIRSIKPLAWPDAEAAFLGALKRDIAQYGLVRP
ncbi:hypothetical protein GCM10011321_31850 [Youhaiella tibetensis]|uniref:Uncharacterized protein n=1 Tax=Paradevosia tibetensis TaxID=1447062 RepID=A0A5B9DII0_9HYPH|nr:hypothetical protein [Youhaiella tibetensis]QEE18856.1 hypothetical protein FNA67_01085 [Youhaiella tibetensis]GGF38529.1 hypothetical protein GCM10011321_31850 [Youhaiella tibetensis]